MSISAHRSGEAPDNGNGQQQLESQTEETTSLLLARTRSHDIGIADNTAVQDTFSDDLRQIISAASEGPKTEWPRSVRYLILLCGVLTSLSFGITQVPMLYMFRLMTCDAYYANHPSPEPSSLASTSQHGVSRYVFSYAPSPFLRHAIDAMRETSPDRCAIHAIETSTAWAYFLTGASTTVFGIANLFIAGNLIKKIGVKRTLMLQTFFPALRLLVQNVGVEVWGSLGIIIIQCSQIVSIAGGPSGYVLVLNTYITETVEYEGRTAALGQLAGCMLYGQAIGFLSGGILADVFGIKAPFRLTLASFLLATVYVAIFLPYITPAEAKATESAGDVSKQRGKTIADFFGPLMVFAPRKFVTVDGKLVRNYGAFLLAWSVLLGILATGYLQTLLQLYSTDVFGFGTTENGWLIFIYSMLRGIFLTFAFPAIIAFGRKHTAQGNKTKTSSQEDSSTLPDPERQPLLSTTSNQPHATKAPLLKDARAKPQQTFTFDLTYARFSLVADGVLTLLCSFVRQGWQMYLVAAILPFAAGTGSAAKGTMLQMIGSSASSEERTDALAGISLVENFARLTTIFVFGFVFAAFTNIGRVELVFTCNAAVALLGFVVLLFARFPPEGSRRLARRASE